MDDETIGRFAKALLSDLEARTSYEGRLLTLVGGLRHHASLLPSPSWKMADLPGYYSLLRELRGLWLRFGP